MDTETIMMSRALTTIDGNGSGSCWTCTRRNKRCDEGLPYCKTCLASGMRCHGYRPRFNWPWSTSTRQTRKRKGTRRRVGVKPLTGNALVESGANQPRLQPVYGVETENNYLVQHYLCNISRIALAVDYNENGYRSLLKLALAHEEIMDGLLAVSASHYCRWQNKADDLSHSHLRRAAKGLKARFESTRFAEDCTTVALMLLFISYEVFLGSTRWRPHYDAIRAWVQSRSDCSDLDPFLKTWICMVDTQCALNTGNAGLGELESWMGGQGDESHHNNMIDPLFGCSVRLPPLMATASRLYIEARELSLVVTIDKVNNLKRSIRETKIDLQAQPILNTTCASTSPNSFCMAPSMGQHDLPRRVMATAEIFRLATELYTHRIAYAPGYDASEEVERLIQEALNLMTVVPDVMGPGANLGWCFVVIGSELDLAEHRDYIRSRVASLHQLGMHNSKSSEKILEHVWAHRDLVACGIAQPLRWQDIVQQIGEQQILV
ncbi:hypothetical protein K491DRAFT_637975 [Lophiostoma macrostomum CBS 122681]|uniref:Zn(2)-C6 fungal-type domain-containing protein n=1 Tax=Lophiostoma macrostomum CBS 122681 TaxID=1314788 RepID=A0A6A6SY63_9PLEO|nr:hypothetical protein K491DRAFT_637975 [Lophiostoma macrostomum CBS 122681]